MSIVIRPSPEVFRRKTPLLVLFGAYRGPDEPEPGPDDPRPGGLVAEARRFRVPVAFCRPAVGDGTGGSWLEGCRPTIRDMLVEIAGESCFSSPDFARALSGFASSAICLCGRAGDSLFESSVADALARGMRISVIDLGGVMRQRSTPAPGAPRFAALELAVELGYVVCENGWLGRIRARTILEGSPA